MQSYGKNRGSRHSIWSKTISCGITLSFDAFWSTWSLSAAGWTNIWPELDWFSSRLSNSRPAIERSTLFGIIGSIHQQCITDGYRRKAAFLLLNCVKIKRTRLFLPFVCYSTLFSAKRYRKISVSLSSKHNHIICWRSLQCVAFDHSRKFEVWLLPCLRYPC